MEGTAWPEPQDGVTSESIHEDGRPAKVSARLQQMELGISENLVRNIGGLHRALAHSLVVFFSADGQVLTDPPLQDVAISKRT